MAPFHNYAKDGKEHSISYAIKFLSQIFNISDKQRNESLSIGKRTILYK